MTQKAKINGNVGEGCGASFTEGLGFNIFYIILDMRNKVLVLLVVVLCLWLTLQGRPAKNKQQRPAEDDSDEQPAKAVPKQQQSSKKKNADANKNGRK
jgi:hypothetical protein